MPGSGRDPSLEMDLTPMASPDRVQQLWNCGVRDNCRPAQQSMRGIAEMKKLALGVLFAGLLVATGCGGDDHPHITLDAGSAAGTCSPLLQTGGAAGEKCTWLVDAFMPQYVGHVGCAPDGTGAVGDQCTYGAAGPPGP